MATSTVAEGKALVALKGGKPLPDGSIVDGDGTLTADPSPLYGEVPEGHYPNPNNGPGALTTFGLHKGSGLNFLMEMMAGALGGSGCAELWMSRRGVSATACSRCTSHPTRSGTPTTALSPRFAPTWRL